MSEIGRITVDAAVCAGRPCLRGLRIRVKDVLDLLAAGATREEILDDYPALELNDVTAALEYAANAGLAAPHALAVRSSLRLTNS